MADTEYVSLAQSNASVYQSFAEPRRRAGSAVHWEVSPAYCRKVVTVDNSAGETSILPGTVIVGGSNAFVGILFGTPVQPGVIEDRTVVYRGPCIIKNEKISFPIITNAVDGNDAGTDTVAENAAATATLETALRAAMAAAGIEIQ